MPSDRISRFPALDRRRLLRHTAAFGAAVPAAGWLTASGTHAQGSPVATPSGNPIRIGATLAATGRYEATAPYLREAYLLWESQQNAAGGLLGRPVEMVIHDDASDPATAATLYEQMISTDKVDLVIGPYASAITLAVRDVTEQHGYPLLSTGASSKEIWEGSPSAVFGVFSTGEQLFREIVLTIAPAQGYTTAAVIYGDDVYPGEGGQGAVAYCEQAGIEIVLEEQYPQQETDFHDLLSRIGDAAPDMILVGSYLPDSVLIMQQMKELDLRADLVAFSVGPAVPDFQEELGADVNFIVGPSMWEPTIATPGNAEFVAAYEAMWNRKPAYHSANGYTGCQVLAQAVTTAGSLDLAAITEQLRTMTMPTILPGQYEVDDTGKSTGHIPLTVQWQDETKVIVAPDDLKTGELQLPVPAWNDRG